MAKRPAYLDPETLARVGSLELRGRMVAEGVLSGMHRSPWAGVSVDFAQHRPYVAGDDLRHLDWKVYGRTDKLYLKQYQHESNLDVHLLVDGSGSMAFGTVGVGGGGIWRKYDCAATAGAAVGQLVSRRGDRVGLGCWGRGLLGSTRMGGGREHVRAVAEVLEGHIPVGDCEAGDESEGGDLGRAIDQLMGRATVRGLVVLISDLLDEVEVLRTGLARLAHRGHDCVVMQVLDPGELRFEYRGALEFEGMEGEGKVAVDAGLLRGPYLEAMGRHLGEVERVCRGVGFDYVLVDSGRPIGPALGHFLMRRARMLGKGR